MVNKNVDNYVSNLNYIDITNEWLTDNKVNIRKVLDATYFKNKDGKRYYVDNKKVVLDYSFNELNAARWFVNIFGGIIYMMPRVNEPVGIKTADYLFKGEFWDLK